MTQYTGFGGFIVLVLAVWAIVSIVGSNSGTGKKVLWILLVVFLPILRFIFWLIAGPRAASGRG